MIENPSDWTALAKSVDAGELTMEPGTARACAQRCAEFAAELGVLRSRAYQLQFVEGFGTLPSGIALAEKFSKKAVGGDYSLVQALTDHIDEVQRMQTVFEKIERRYAETEQANASRFGAIDPE
ncbi:hypothetical protein [Prescottella subtropica]|uniref:hypothetical protein n=1 Tax=Prescottella subtropica TaxID=2545757 RepID=UPI0010FA3AF2|nr:hypothetical protein [Prescottella subtropica]